MPSVAIDQRSATSLHAIVHVATTETWAKVPLAEKDAARPISRLRPSSPPRAGAFFGLPMSIASTIAPFGVKEEIHGTGIQGRQVRTMRPDET